MPLTSEADAKAWRDADTQRGATGARMKSEGTAAPPSWGEGESKSETAADETQREIDLLRQLTNEARAQIQKAATVNERASAVRNYTQLLDSLRKYEKEYPAIMKAADAVVLVSDVERAGFHCAALLRRCFEEFPANLAREIIDHQLTEYHAIVEACENFVEGWKASSIKRFPFVLGGPDDPRDLKHDAPAD